MLFDITTREYFQNYIYYFFFLIFSLFCDHFITSDIPKIPIFFNRANAVVRTIRTIRKGEEILDNYGYHYAVMPREERKRKL